LPFSTKGFFSGIFRGPLVRFEKYEWKTESIENKTLVENKIPLKKKIRKKEQNARTIRFV